MFIDPNTLKPGQTIENVTEEVANRFAQLADNLRSRNIPMQRAAYFLMKLMFCMFAEDIDLLPEKVFTKILMGSRGKTARLTSRLRELFEKMAQGGDYGADAIRYFNGGLFADTDVVELASEEVDELIEINECDWSNVEPSIFGTLLERTIDPGKRDQVGRHYTGRKDIESLLEPVLMVPLRREWEEVKRECKSLFAEIKESVKQRAGSNRRKDSKPRQKFDRLLLDFVQRISQIKVLDPACGSGNFLYVAINQLLSLEKEVITYAANHDTPIMPHVSPTQLEGIEINSYARELAQVVVWIGHLQWKYQNGFAPQHDPVLASGESIRRMDAILDLSDSLHPREPEWPEVDVIVGNPPFLGDKKMRSELGDEYVNALRSLYEDRLPGQSDLCCYWFEKARAMIQTGKAERAGLLATQGIRGGNNRSCLDRIQETGNIFWACSDRDWILDGATVHVSMIGFDDGTEEQYELNGETVNVIHSNLTGGSRPDVCKAMELAENAQRCFLGVMKAGAFDIEESLALEWLCSPNPHGRPNSDVLRPRLTARDILQRLPVGWIIDFGCDSIPEDMALYEKPWVYVETNVKPVRESNHRLRLAKEWWIHGEPRPGLRRGLHGLSRFVVTPEVSKHRIFVWLDGVHLADHQTRAFTSQDDCFFGILHSRIHEVWSRAMGTQLREVESGFRYTPTTCFGTFPFPKPTKGQQTVIAEAAQELDRLRNRWLNPSEWTREEMIEFPGSANGPWHRYIHDPDERGIGMVRFPRLVPKDDVSADGLAARTLTNLYNERPTWLVNAHRDLDEAVFAAYDWKPGMGHEEILEQLLKLNREIAAQQDRPVDAETSPAVVGD